MLATVGARLQLTTSQHEIRVHAGQTSLLADRDHLEQVLDNLLSNAIKFSPRGGTIDMRVADRPDGVEFSVHDPGVGIPSHQLDAVFGLFFQAEDPVSRRTGVMPKVTK